MAIATKGRASGYLYIRVVVHVCVCLSIQVRSLQRGPLNDVLAGKLFVILQRTAHCSSSAVQESVRPSASDQDTQTDTQRGR